jgi:hypothetical protein
MTLSGTDLSGQALPAQTTTTAANGSYSFTGLPAGNYALQKAASPNYQEGTTTPGQPANGIASGDAIHQIALAAGSGLIDYNFDERFNVGLLLLDPSGKGSLSDSGEGQILVRASVAVNSRNKAAITIDDSGLVTGNEFDVTGTPGIRVSDHGKIQGTIISGHATMADPLATLLPPTATQHVFTQVNCSENKTYTLNPGIYRGGIQVSGKATVLLQPGIYELDGDGLSVAGQANLIGKSVLIYNVPLGNHPDQDNNFDDGITVKDDASVFLTPCTSGPYAGFAVFQDRSGISPIQVTDHATLNLDGALYAPNARLIVSDNACLNVEAAMALPLVVAADLSVSQHGHVVLAPNDGSGEVAGPLGPVQPSQWASLGFWQSKDKGQAVLTSFNGGASTALGNYLASHFSSLFGNLAGKTNSDLAGILAKARHDLWDESLVLALYTYDSTFSLGGECLLQTGLAARLDLPVTFPGVGPMTFDVGADAAAFGVPNGQGTSLTLLQILHALNNDYNSSAATFYGGNSTLSAEALQVLKGIAQSSPEMDAALQSVAIQHQDVKSGRLLGWRY